MAMDAPPQRLAYWTLVQPRLTTVGVVIGVGFASFIFLAYYPALAIFAVVCSSTWFSHAWTTMVAVA